MRVHEMLPVEETAQRTLAAAWERVMAEGPDSLASVDHVRPSVRASWTRALARGVRPTLPRAPQCLDESALAHQREAADWLPYAEQIIRHHASGAVPEGHVLALFDDQAHMLSAAGDPQALAGLADINFRPGALWSEEAVGTNGPGTALATGRPVHIIGAEHFCARWQGWHCAAVPVHDPLTKGVIGLLDLSGFRDKAHPHTLALATAIAAALEQRLTAREAERRVMLLRQFATLVGRYPTDQILVVDRTGDIIAASATADRLVRRLQACGRDASAALRGLSTDNRPDRRGRKAIAHEAVRDATHPLIGGTATVHAMVDDPTAIGACLVVPRATPRRPDGGRAMPPGPPPSDAPGQDRRSRADSRSTRYELGSLLGAAPGLEEVRRFARACARTDLPVLLLGESGTGKEVVAQGIHAASPRAGAPFVAVNCAALPRELVESELFGHVAGAFSGARREGAIGKFEAADGGTLFLDEIGELPPAAQAALLRVLQEGEITRLGATTGRSVDVRIIAATNREIPGAIASGALRDDLYHRLNVLTLSLPPLRSRQGDAVLLARHFLSQLHGSLAREFAPTVLVAFQRYGWPGNVRELENLVKRLAALAEGPVITEDLLPAALRNLTTIRADHRPLLPADTRDGSPPRRLAPGHHGAEAAEVALTTGTADATVREALRARYAALVAAHATMRDAAASIGVTRSTLYRRLQRLGLAPGRGVREAD